VHVGKASDRKYRDYDVQVVRAAPDKEGKEEHTVLARARVIDFAGGVYKQFLVCGPDEFSFRIARNRSACTKLQGVFIDQLTGDRPDNGEPQAPGGVHFEAPEADENAPANTADLVAAARGLWEALDEALDKRGNAALQIPFRLCAYRAAA